MTDELISKAALLKGIQAAKDHGGVDAAVANTLTRYINRQETIEAAPVRRGQWVDGVCSDCGFDAMYHKDSSAQVYTNFCPNCGADMREDERETN